MTIRRLLSPIVRRAMRFSWFLLLLIGVPDGLAHAWQIGIEYSLWHCPASSSRHYHPDGPVYDISQILAGKQSWGPIHEFHWWGKPDAGYYCLAENPDLLRRHAELLRDAGVDFVVIDATNQPKQADSGPDIIEPFAEMIKTWNNVSGAPKIVPWVPIIRGGDMVEYLDRMLKRYPQMAFNYEGRPLLLAAGNLSEPAAIRSEKDRGRYTIRTMWGLLGLPQLRSGEWSFMQPCAAGFRAAAGNEVCRQQVTYHQRAVEQISVAAAYQTSYMSDKSSAVPKFHGRTLLRQLQTAHFLRTVPIVTIAGWNEWIAQSFCADDPDATRCEGPKHDPSTITPVFVDQFDAEYSRDLEPGGGLGDYYYRLMKRGIMLLRSGRDPIGALR